MLEWFVVGRTHAGLQREKEQDSFFISDDKQVFAIADGMGGTTNKPSPSKVVIDIVESLWRQDNFDRNSRIAIRKWIVATLLTANKRIIQIAERNSSPCGFGSTAILVVQAEDGYIEIGHVGNSVAYLKRRGKLLQLTQTTHNRRTAQLLGQSMEVEVGQTELQMASKDMLLLCTDGVTSVLQNKQIAFHTVDNRLETACASLIRAALDSGASGDVTVITIEYSAKTDTNDDEPPTARVPLTPKPRIDITASSLRLPEDERKNE